MIVLAMLAGLAVLALCIPQRPGETDDWLRSRLLMLIGASAVLWVLFGLAGS